MSMVSLFHFFSSSMRAAMIGSHSVFSNLGRIALRRIYFLLVADRVEVHRGVIALNLFLGMLLGVGLGGVNEAAQVE